MAVRTADLPEPFSPERKVTLWLGWKVNFYKQWKSLVTEPETLSHLVTHEVPHHHLQDHPRPSLPHSLLLLLAAGGVPLVGWSLGRAGQHHRLALPLGCHGLVLAFTDLTLTLSGNYKGLLENYFYAIACISFKL